MSENQTGNPDNLPAQTGVASPTGDNPAAPINTSGAPVDTDNARYLGTYKTRTDAEKGVHELRESYTQKAMENAELKARLDMLEKQVKVAPAGQSREDAEARINEVIKSIADKARAASDPYEVMAAENLKVARSMAMDAVEAARAERQQEIAELRKTLQDYDPAYVSNRKEIDDIAQKTGVDRATAKKLYETVIQPMKANGNGVPQMPRVAKPGTPQSGTGGGDDGEQVEVPQHEIARIKAFNFPAESEKRAIESLRKSYTGKSKRSN